MFKIRNISFLKFSKDLISPRLLADSAKKGDSKSESCKEESKKKKKKNLDLCGRPKLPTKPKCKNPPGGGSDDKSGDKCKKN
ncbi:uncharacterized protein LOC108113925 [Drosophila eugracilis]|uniref:uncharacterized protein LOC108113925 n=1 Tax=Drosophila eugracilis TaxID=29029 RepID=UPI001BDB04AE|nr:uncharacterized protein LOC108113925 [Drosophila eugracilis]